MSANSIDIGQYRSRIGTFTGRKSSCNTSIVSSGRKLTTSTVLESFIILSYLLVLSNVTQTLLIVSGLELNPGPQGSRTSLGKNYFIDKMHFYIRNGFCYSVLLNMLLFAIHRVVTWFYIMWYSNT